MNKQKHIIALLFFLFTFNFILLNTLNAQTSHHTLLQKERHLLYRFDEERHQMLRERDNPLLHQQHLFSTKLNTIGTGDSLNVRLIGRWANGPCYAVDVVGNIAYFGNGAYLEIVDFSDPKNPVELGRTIAPSPIRSLTTSGNYVYIANREYGLRVIEFTDENTLREVGFLDTKGNAFGEAVSGFYVYIADGIEGLCVIDVSNPSHPQEVGSYNTNDLAVDVEINGNYAYIADTQEGLRVIDVSLPNKPQEVGFFDPGNTWDVAVNQNYVYLANGNDGISIIDVSDPTSPTEIGSLNTKYDANHIQIYGNYAFVISFYYGLSIIDVSEPDNPKEIGYYEINSGTHDVRISGNNTYLASDDNGLILVDISILSQPQYINNYDTRDFTENVTVSNNYAYVANGSDGLRILDIRTPNYPQEVGYYVTEGYAMDVVVINSYAYVASDVGGLRVIDISTPSNPQEIGFYDGVDRAYGVFVGGNYAYVTDHYGGLRVIDISTPSNLQEVGFYDIDGSAYDVYVSGNYAYVANYNRGLRVIDVSNPSQPKEIGFFDTNGNVLDVVINKENAYVADHWGGFRVIDVRDPNQLHEVSSYTGISALGVKISDNYAYIATDSDGMYVLDISNPNEPRLVGFYDTGDYANAVAFNNGFIFLSDGSDGLYIFEYLGLPPESPALSQPASNSYTNDNFPSLSWNVPIDSDGDDLHFKVEISTNSSFSSQISGSPFESKNSTTGFSPTPPVAEGSGTCSYTQQNSLTDGSYYWRVSAWDVHRYGNTSASRKFTVDTAAPYTAEHNPAKSATGVSTSTNIVVHIKDNSSGVNQSSVVMKVNGSAVTSSITGSSSDYTITYDPPTDFGLNETISVSIDAKDNAGNAMETDSYSFTTATDQTAPQITHSTVTTANSGESKTISAVLTDNIGIKSATIYYRAGGAAAFNSITMNNNSGDTYEATIPASAVTEYGLEYYISVEDNSGNVTTYPSGNPAENPQVIQVINSNFAFASATPAMAYRMISVPFDLDNSSPASVLEDDLGSYDDTEWRLLRYVNGNNVEYSTSGFTSFEPGNGFWLITKESISLDAGAGKSVTTAQNYTITLQPGWNQIGNPFAFTVNWNDVVKDANVEARLVGYYGELNEDNGYDYTRTQLEPWQGYFVNNLSSSPTTIEIPPKAASGALAKPLANILSLYDFKDNEWGVQITAECSYYLDKDNYLGCLQEASDTRDRHDFSEAPFFDKHVSLYFPHEDWEAFPGWYTGDFRSIAAEGQFWDFCVKTNYANTEVTLALADIQNVPVDWEIVLLDKLGNISLNFQQKEKYTFLPGDHETVRNFRIIIGGTQYIDSNDLDILEIPQTFKLSQNYPNPFNPDTQINYILPTVTRVKITIFNLIGEQISVLIDGQQGAGRYSVSWNGTNDGGEPVTSGVYLVRMEAGKFVAVRKMVLVR